MLHRVRLLSEDNILRPNRNTPDAIDAVSDRCDSNLPLDRWPTRGLGLVAQEHAAGKKGAPIRTGETHKL